MISDVERRDREYEERLRSLTAQLLLAEERERRKIASDLHDHIGQSLALIKMRLNLLRESAGTTKISNEFEQLLGQVSKVIEDSRSLVFEISPPVLYRLGFIPTIEWLVEHFEKKHQLRIHLTIEADDPMPHPEEMISIFFFRATKELLFNVVKHAGTRDAHLKIKLNGDEIAVVVADEGGGMSIGELDGIMCRKNTYGLFSIEERLRYLGGEFSVFSNPGKGTTVKMTAPLKMQEQITDGI